MKPIRRWLHGVAVALGMLVATAAAPAQTITYYHNDPAGSPLLATDQRGEVLWKETYRPYGERLVGAPAAAGNPIGHAGRPFDAATGLSYLGARYYDPVLGRFLAADPAAADPGSVHGVNRYAYANNNPSRYVDPDGHSPLDVAFLAWDLGKLGAAVYSGRPAGVAEALGDVAMSAIGVVSPVPGAGQALKAARVAEKAVEAGRTLDRASEAARVAAKGAGDAAYIVTPRGVAIPTNAAELKGNLSKLTEASTSPATSRKFVGTDSTGPLRVRVERGHQADPRFNGKPDPLHTVDHLHIDRRADGNTGPWSSQEKTGYGWPF